ncbi:MAG: ATP-binding protein [Desulfovibrionaceae bacterium]
MTDGAKGSAEPRELVVISGKGGTGKTSITAALAHLAAQDAAAGAGPAAVLCDLDVDAPDLHILLDPKPEHEEDFVSGHEAVIDSEACTGCGECAARCRFEAVREADDGVYAIDPLRCEGCKVCVTFCPVGAVDFTPRRCGMWWRSRTRFGAMVHARLFPGEENSGRLVTLIKREARDLAKAGGQGIILCDGAPGIGCPVISSLAGAHRVLIVTEPTLSGLHDLERVAGLCAHFRIPVSVLVNRCDINEELTDRVRALCREHGWDLAGGIPLDPAVVRAQVERRAITEGDAPEAAAELRRVWDRLRQALDPAAGTGPAS